MAKMVPGALRRTGDMKIPIPSRALEDWLTSDKCRRSVQIIAIRIATLYKQSLPVSKPSRNRKDKQYTFGDNRGPGHMNLRNHVGIKDAIISEPGKSPRWHAWVVNTALSYRPTQGQPYPAFIEYGRANGGQLRRAADQVAYMLNQPYGYELVVHEVRESNKAAAAEQRRRQAKPQPAPAKGSLAERVAAQREQRRGPGARPRRNP